MLLVVLTCAAAFAQQPWIDSVSPSHGSIAGNTIVTVTGANFTGAVIKLDRAVATPLSQLDSQIRLDMPAHDNGYSVISISNGFGAAYGEFLYIPPRLSDIPPGYITTVAGVGIFSGDYRQGTNAIVAPWGSAVDGAGNIYIAEPSKNRIIRIRPDGVVEPFAGNGTNSGPRPSTPTNALSVSISYPRSMAFDLMGNVYIPDSEHYVWRVTPDGVAQRIAGTGRAEFSGDGGAAVVASLGHPNYVAVDGAGNVYVLCFGDARIRKIDRSGTITTVAGNGTRGFSGDGGLATLAQFDIPNNDQGGLVSDETGNLFLLDFSNRRIRRVDAANGVITTIVDEVRARASLDNLKAIALGRNGDLYFSQGGASIFLRTPDGLITQVSSGRSGFSPDGTLLRDAKLSGVGGLAVTANGELLISEGARVRRADTSGRLRTIAGVGPGRIDEGSLAVGAVIISEGVDPDVLPDGGVIFDDNDRIRKIDSAGVVTTIAGSGTAGPIEDVPAIEANISPFSTAVAPDGSLDFINLFGVFTIGSDSILRRKAGVFTVCDYTGDGASALAAKFCQPWDVNRDAAGNLLIADTNNNRVRRIDHATGIITTIAGSGPANGWERYGQGRTCGDGGRATEACLNTPYGVVEDDQHNLYISHVDVNGRIRRVDPSGTISTFSETPATKMTTLRNVLYAVSGDRVVRFSPHGELTVIAGSAGNVGFSGDGGPATLARMMARGSSNGLAIDAEGDLFFSDGNNRRIRAIRFGAVLPPPGATVGATTSGALIRATVVDASGRPAPAVRLDFRAPSSGPSCQLSNSFAITDSNGVATVTCTPNCIGGTYAVTLQTVVTVPTATASFTNAAGPCRRRAVRH